MMTSTGRRITPRAVLDQNPSAGGRTERRHTVTPLIRGPKQGQDGGEHDQGGRPGQQDDGDAGVGEGAEEDEREDQERAGGGGHGDRAPRHGAPGVRHRLLQRGGGVVAGAQLLPEPADDEEAVVDGQTEAQTPWPGSPRRWRRG